MKQFVRIGVLCAAVAALAVGSTAIAGAGKFDVQGNLVITPDPVELGGKVTISNAADEDSTCEWPDGPSDVSVIIYNDNYDLEMTTTPDDSTGDWSVEFEIPDDPAALGEWEVDAFCGNDPPEIEALALPEFFYPLTPFDVVAPVDPIVPDDGTEAAEEVRTEPRFTG